MSDFLRKLKRKMTSIVSGNKAAAPAVKVSAKKKAPAGDKQHDQAAGNAQKRSKQLSGTEKHISRIMEATGWDREETISQVEHAREVYDISYRDYDRYKFYRHTTEESRKAAYARICEKREQARQQRENCITKTMTLTGWTREQAEERIADARKRTHCKYKEYTLYKFYEMTPEEQEQFALINLTAALSKQYNVNAEFAKMLDNKEKTNTYFSELIARPWGVNTKDSFEEFSEKFANSSRIIYKPIEGIGGHGIQSFDLTGDNMQQVWEEIKQLPDGVVEEYVSQHPDLNALCPSSVNTLRVVTISSKTKPVTPDGKYMDIAYAALRIGGGSTVVDNFHSGGMVAAVDLETGKLVTDAANMAGQMFAAHPVTGKVFKGFQIPMFDKVIQFVEDACAKDIVEGNLGWDIAITENGPVLIEANVGPGVVLLQTPYAAEHKGMKHVMAKYLKTASAAKSTDAPKSAKALEREHAIECIMKTTGWDREKTVAEIRDAHKRTGCTAKEFFIYRFYELDEKTQESFFLIRDSVKLRKKYDVDKKLISMLCNKEKTNQYFSEYLKRPWCVNTKVSPEKFVELFADSRRIIYKPLAGNRGRGVEAFDITPDNAKEIYEKLSTFPDGVVEQYVHQHPAVSSLCPSSVNTLRVVTISSATEPVTADGKYMDVAYAALRIGGGSSVVDNFHSGGMTAAVDLETGELVTDGADMEGHVFPVHPVTGTKIKGFKIPYFKEAMDMVLEACSKHHITGYLGWDIGISVDGPVLIEVNAGPGVVLLSTPYAPEGIGKKYVMEKYL